MHAHLSWLEAGTIGAIQGVTELFPVSSLGHSVLIPALIGGSWAKHLNVNAPESPYLAFIVGLHVATALALIIYFWRDWVRIIAGLFTSLRYRRISNDYERLGWLLILATIPVGIAGLALEHALRTTLGKPTPAAIFLMVNGLILFASERWKRRAVQQEDLVETVPASRHRAGETVSTSPMAVSHQSEEPSDTDLDHTLAQLPWPRALLIGAAQILALAPGISRSGAAMATGLARGLSHEAAARFSFLLATPVILAAGVLKVPDLFGPLGDGIRPQVLFGSVLSGVGAYLSVRFLSRYFEKRSLRPFAWYCLLFGAGSLIILH
ncbi:undecaprenyl-diphosphate phosphatase [Jatrophihabitans telluris]|uniref:Undecaprenyl-diphosphatase n=1 Tax=Jatrophihabitans telluris TaxID=2038343 RepID=A0ABY4QVB5_9ACTN|nr:undecaprenyl-diphosphate phosphatase [Jatrophihabitans telluris]UQX87603.1 undecaprenyl-diphosphate phosphatase [Jatrophihabitans telluris]